MTNIWAVLVREPRKAVDEHFQTILSELLREMGAKLWRNREAACLALADLLQGRRWADVKDRLEEMWRMAFRALDDIKVCLRSRPLPFQGGHARLVFQTPMFLTIITRVASSDFLCAFSLHLLASTLGNDAAM